MDSVVFSQGNSPRTDYDYGQQNRKTADVTICGEAVARALRLLGARADELRATADLTDTEPCCCSIQRSSGDGLPRRAVDLRPAERKSGQTRHGARAAGHRQGRSSWDHAA